MRTLAVITVMAAAALASASAHAEGDAAKGEKVFKKCTACHTVEDGKNRVGPHLHALFGRAAGAVEGYKYSAINQAAGAAGLTWTEETLAGYLPDPQKFLADHITASGGTPTGRTKMTYRLTKPDEVADVIAYLKTFSPAQ
ncbi:MAG: c-type cytochrome [Rhizobiales bacterium]|nr:c-type cytochrome [Hyphomicrobiales bacterium]